MNILSINDKHIVYIYCPEVDYPIKITVDNKATALKISEAANFLGFETTYESCSLKERIKKFFK